MVAGFQFDGKNATINLKTDAAKLILNSPIQNFTGRLKLYDDSSSRITAASSNDVIIFSDGTLNAGSGDINFTGTFVPGATTTALQLGAGSNLNLNGQTIARPINIAAGETAELKGSPALSGDISLASSTSQLNLGLINKLAYNVVLSGGTVQLTEDLSFKDGQGFSGSGTVNINNRTLIRPGGFAYTGTINYQNAADVEFTDNQTLNGGTENYSGVGLYSLINGNGYTWNIINSGQIQVGANHTLYLTDMRIKGLGPTASAGYFDLDPTASIVLANVTLDLGDNYTHSQGTLLVQGDNCKLISHGNTFTVNSAQTRLQIDGVAFLYEPLDGANVSPFSFADPTQHIVYSNGGVIRSAESSSGESTLVIDTTPYTLASNQRLTATSGLQFTNENPGAAKSMTLDGGGFYLQFPSVYNPNLLELQTNVQLTLQNITLKDFDPSMINYEDPTSAIIFGEGCRIQLARDISLSPSDPAWAFVLPALPAYVDAAGHTLTLDGSSRLTLDGQGVTAGRINFENGRLATTAADALTCLHYNGEIALKNSQLQMNNQGLIFALGNIFIDGHSKISGSNPTTPSGSSIFTFSSSGSMTILSQATLEISPDTTFVYAPDPGPGNETLTQTKRHLKFSDPSAALILNACSFTTSNTGLALDYGKLFVHNKVNFTVSTADAAEFEVGTALDLNIMGAGLLSFDGPVKYVASSYP